jgi:aminoglycoside 6-adenylyltransferase
MILQMPEAIEDPPPQNNGTFSYLMQFSDGNRIDLTLFPIAKLDQLGKDSLSILLLDKHGIIEPFAPPSDVDYVPRPPSAKLFADCCNEFWWVSTYVAKGLWREEITYAKWAMDEVVREQLMKMFTWYVGVKTQFAHNPGKYGKYLKQYLEPELWVMCDKTYSDASYEHTWDALFTMCDLFRLIALSVAAHFGFEYPNGDDERVSAHLRHVRNLANDAEEIY